MTDKDTATDGPTPQDVSAQVDEAVSAGIDVRAEVERITREALAGQWPDPDRVQRVIRAVGEGAATAAARHPDTARQSVADALDGLQGALSHGAETARLAIEEAAGQAQGYSRDGLEKALADLSKLETMMLDALSQAARTGSDVGERILSDFVAHARRNGTRLGNDVSAAMRALARDFPEAARESALAGLDAMSEAGARAFEVASGVLGAFADALRDSARGKGNSRREGEGGPEQ